MAWHAKLSASQTKQWWNCPGSLAVLEAHPELKKESGSYARMGTVAHHVLEVSLGNGKDAWHLLDRVGRIILDKKTGDEKGVSVLKLGAEVSDSSIDFEIDEEMCEAVQTCIDYVRGRLKEHTGSDDTAAAVKGGTLRLETRVNPLPHRDDAGGTGDVAIDIWPELYEIVDYKNGSGVFVPVEANYQLRSYLAGGLHEHDAWDYDELRYTISQPRHMQSPQDGIMSETISKSDLLEWVEDLDLAAQRVDKARALTKSHGAQTGIQRMMEQLDEARLISVGQDGDHCSWCELKHRCPAISRKVQEIAAVDFDDDLPEDGIESPGHNQLAVAMHWAPLIKDWVAEVFAAAEQELMSGGKLDGFKVVYGKSPGRKFKTDATEAKVKAYAKKKKVDEDKLYKQPKPPELKTAVQIQKLFTVDDRADFEAKFMFKAPGKPTVVPESDKRPAIDVNPGEDFDDDL